MKTSLSVYSAFAILFVFFSTQACGFDKTVRGNGHVVKQERGIGSFSAISASAGINVYLFQGDVEKVIVEADENIMGCIHTEIDGNTLKCYVDCDVQSSTKMNVYVNYKTLEKIHASSGSDVYAETVIKTDNLTIDASSAADIKVEVEAVWVKCQSSSGADVVLKGSAKSLNADASSGADIKGHDFRVAECNAHASSGADVEIYVTDQIEADASSGGDVKYWGDPKETKVRESSGGDVSKK